MNNYNNIYSIESVRLASFTDWPISIVQKPHQLSDAGFYYIGKGDQVQCFSCGGGLKDWSPNDLPWEQHAMWYSKCKYLKLVKGQEFIDNILVLKNKPITPTTTKLSIENETTTKLSVENTTKSLDEEKDNSKLCKICYSYEYNTVFVPCGHVITCAKCALSVNSCPYCRQEFTDVIKLYYV